jgi:hypothetical protein
MIAHQAGTSGILGLEMGRVPKPRGRDHPLGLVTYSPDGVSVTYAKHFLRQSCLNDRQADVTQGDVVMAKRGVLLL